MQRLFWVGCELSLKEASLEINTWGAVAAPREKKRRFRTCRRSGSLCAFVTVGALSGQSARTLSRPVWHEGDHFAYADLVRGADIVSFREYHLDFHGTSHENPLVAFARGGEAFRAVALLKVLIYLRLCWHWDPDLETRNTVPRYGCMLSRTISVTTASCSASWPPSSLSWSS